MKASIKNLLKVGTSVTILSFENREGIYEIHKSQDIARLIAVRQTNAIKFEWGSWLYFWPASQSEWIDEANKIFRVWDIDNWEKRAILTYKIN